MIRYSLFHLVPRAPLEQARPHPLCEPLLMFITFNIECFFSLFPQPHLQTHKKLYRKLFRIRWETQMPPPGNNNLWPEDNQNSSLCICEYHHMCGAIQRFKSVLWEHRVFSVKTRDSRSRFCDPSRSSHLSVGISRKNRIFELVFCKIRTWNSNCEKTLLKEKRHVLK
jgi:hypothetical protein